MEKIKSIVPTINEYQKNLILQLNDSLSVSKQTTKNLCNYTDSLLEENERLKSQLQERKTIFLNSKK